MEDAFEAVASGVRNVVQSPMLVVSTALVLVLLVPVVVVIGTISLIGMIVVIGPLIYRFALALLVKPVLYGGVVGLATAGFEGDVSPSDALDALGDGRGISLAGAYAVQEVLLFAIGIGLFLVHLGVQSVGAVAGLSDGVLQLWSGGVALLAALLFAVVVSTLQFVDVAAILDGASAREALQRSYTLTRERPTEVAIYTVLRTLLVVVLVLPGLVIVGVDLAMTVEPSTVTAPPVLDLVGWATTLLLLPFGVAAALSTHVAYYRRRSPHRQ